jgi:hypothetical protein
MDIHSTFKVRSYRAARRRRFHNPDSNAEYILYSTLTQKRFFVFATTRNRHKPDLDN